MMQLTLFDDLADVEQFNQAKAILSALPTSHKVQRLQKLYGGSDAEKILRETLAVDSPLTRPSVISLVELISILWGTLDDPEPATHLLIQLKDLRTVGNRSVQELVNLGHGITKRRAQQLLAALKLVQRSTETPSERASVKSPQDCANVLSDMGFLEQEQMRVVSMNTKNHILDVTTVYQGSVNTTVIRIAELLRPVIALNASACIIAHNHPSGDPTPSPVIWRKKSRSQLC